MPTPRRGRSKTRWPTAKRCVQRVKLASGDYIDLKMYEPAMRDLLDMYIRAEETAQISTFDNQTLVQLIAKRGENALASLPAGIRENREAMAETIENNVRRIIIDEDGRQPQSTTRKCRPCSTP